MRILSWLVVGWLSVSAVLAQPKPEVYGTYGIVDGKLIELKSEEMGCFFGCSPNGDRPLTTFPSGKLSFLVYSRDARLVSVDSARVNIIGKVTKALDIHQDGRRVITDANSWNVTRWGFDFAIAPAHNNPQMILVKHRDPSFELPPGRFALQLGERFASQIDFGVAGETPPINACWVTVLKVSWGGSPARQIERCADVQIDPSAATALNRPPADIRDIPPSPVAGERREGLRRRIAEQKAALPVSPADWERISFPIEGWCSMGDKPQSLSARDSAGPVRLSLRPSVSGEVHGFGIVSAIVADCGSNAMSNAVFLFGQEQGRLVLLEMIPLGSGALGGIAALSIADGSLVVERYAGEARCCPKYVNRTRWQWQAGAFRPVNSTWLVAKP